MMVSFTPCCARSDRALRWLAGLLLACWLAVAGSALAADRSAVRQAAIRATPQGYVLDADIDIVLNHTLEDALSKGISLYFLVELELTRPRGWWWLDEDIAEPVPEALALLGRVNDWQVLERGALKTGRRYDARLRLRLDTTQLPKPLSIGGVPGDNWELATYWLEWSFDAPAIPAAASPAAAAPALP
jgi:hypothetical protein